MGRSWHDGGIESGNRNKPNAVGYGVMMICGIVIAVIFMLAVWGLI